MASNESDILIEVVDILMGAICRILVFILVIKMSNCCSETFVELSVGSLLLPCMLASSVLLRIILASILFLSICLIGY